MTSPNIYHIHFHFWLVMSIEIFIHFVAEAVKADQDSIGGVVTCVCRNVPSGWGEPVFDKVRKRSILKQTILIHQHSCWIDIDWWLIFFPLYSCFNQIEALLAHAMLSIPASKGFEIGSGFSGATMRGSEHNDMFIKREDGRLGTSSNFRFKLF